MLSRHSDPIAAIATAPGRGAVGIVRVESECASYALAQTALPVRFCRFEAAERKFIEVHADEVRKILDRIRSRAPGVVPAMRRTMAGDAWKVAAASDLLAAAVRSTAPAAPVRRMAMAQRLTPIVTQ